MHPQMTEANNPYTDWQSAQAVFDPSNYIEMLADGFALCHNPSAGAGLASICVNTNLSGEALRNFEQSVKRMVLSKLFSPKFGEVILTATQLRLPPQAA